MKMGPKGQVVIPKPFREKMGVHPGEQVDVMEPDANGEARFRAARPQEELTPAEAARRILAWEPPPGKEPDWNEQKKQMLDEVYGRTATG